MSCCKPTPTPATQPCCSPSCCTTDTPPVATRTCCSSTCCTPPVATRTCCSSTCCTTDTPPVATRTCCSSTCCTTDTPPVATQPCCSPSCCTADTPAKASASTQSSCCDSKASTKSTKSSCGSSGSCCEKPAQQKVSGLTKPACCDTKLSQGAEVKRQVREDYARVALATAHNADTVAAAFGYTQQELSAIPDGANMGVSCGNPLALANVKEGEVVVDLGCGRGLDVFLAAPKVGSSGKVYGIDMTPEMLAKARENAAKRNITNVEFVPGDIEALPLPDNSVDLVISNCVINLVPDKQKAFTEIYRILKPGGRLAISDILKKKPLPEELRDKLELVSTCFVGAMTHPDAVDFLQKAGFKSILISDANVDLNAYKMLAGEEGGCGGCCSTPITSKLDIKDIEFNEYAFSGKIFASKQ